MCDCQPACERTTLGGATPGTVIKAESGSKSEVKRYFHMHGSCGDCV